MTPTPGMATLPLSPNPQSWEQKTGFILLCVGATWQCLKEAAAWCVSLITVGSKVNTNTVLVS